MKKLTLLLPLIFTGSLIAHSSTSIHYGLSDQTCDAAQCVMIEKTVTTRTEVTSQHKREVYGDYSGTGVFTGTQYSEKEHAYVNDTHTHTTVNTQVYHYPLSPNKALSLGAQQKCWDIIQAALTKGAVVQAGTLNAVLDIAARHDALGSIYQYIHPSLLPQALSHGISCSSWVITESALAHGAPLEIHHLYDMIKSRMQDHALDIALTLGEWPVVKLAIEKKAHLSTDQYEELFTIASADAVLDLAISGRKMDLAQLAITTHNAQVESKHLCALLDDINTTLRKSGEGALRSFCSASIGAITAAIVAITQENRLSDRARVLTAVASGATAALLTWFSARELQNKLATVETKNLSLLIYQGSCRDSAQRAALVKINSLMRRYKKKPKVIEALKPLEQIIATLPIASNQN